MYRLLSTAGKCCAYHVTSGGNVNVCGEGPCRGRLKLEQAHGTEAWQIDSLGLIDKTKTILSIIYGFPGSSETRVICL